MNIKTWQERYTNCSLEQAMQAEIDELRAYLATLKDAHELVAAAMAVMVQEANALKQQEPVGVVVRVDSDMAPGCSYLQGTMIKNTPDGALLYPAAGAQP